MTKKDATIAQAIDESQCRLIKDGAGFLLGQGVTSPWYIGGSTKEVQKLCSAELFDTPISESAVTGMALGIAVRGKNVIIAHPRMDFMWYAMDSIVNGLSTFRSNYGPKDLIEKYGKIIIRAMINRGSGQGAQHSQALNTVFAHIPGLDVLFPVTPASMALAYRVNGDEVAKIIIEERNIYECRNNDFHLVEPLLYKDGVGFQIRRNLESPILIVGSGQLLLNLVNYPNKNLISNLNIIIIENLKVSLDYVLPYFSHCNKIFIVDDTWGGFGIIKEWYYQISCNLAYKKSQLDINLISLPDKHLTSNFKEEEDFFTKKNLYRILGEL